MVEVIDLCGQLEIRPWLRVVDARVFDCGLCISPPPSSWIVKIVLFRSVGQIVGLSMRYHIICGEETCGYSHVCMKCAVIRHTAVDCCFHTLWR